jgi:hydroxymethylpyrimidine pyrophosphatase-like HAD family hydrolase
MAGVGGLAICSNGATVYDLDRKRVLRERVLETEVATRLVRALRERVPGVHFAVESGAELSLEPGFNAWDWEPPPEMRIADLGENLYYLGRGEMASNIPIDPITEESIVECTVSNQKSFSIILLPSWKAVTSQVVNLRRVSMPNCVNSLTLNGRRPANNLSGS